MNEPLQGWHHSSGLYARLLPNTCLPDALYNECRQEVIQLAKTRLKLSGAAKEDAELLRPGGKFDGRPVDYALSKFQFFACNKCHQPYYGGLKECGAPQQQPAGPGEVAGRCWGIRSQKLLLSCLSQKACAMHMQKQPKRALGPPGPRCWRVLGHNICMGVTGCSCLLTGIHRMGAFWTQFIAGHAHLSVRVGTSVRNDL